MEEENINEYRENLEKSSEGISQKQSWMKYLALYTVIIAVIAAIASLASGSYSNEAVLEKNNAVLSQNKASDQWNYYQAKGIKGVVSNAFYTQFHSQNFKDDGDKYRSEQADIKKQAEQFQKEAENADAKSELYLKKHHKSAFAVTFFQIAIALSALSSLMKKRSFFFGSVLLSFAGLVFLILGLI